MKKSTKKEVSCKALDPIFYYAKQNNVDLNGLIQGTPYELSYLLKKRERIEWWVWCKIISNARTYFSPIEFEEMGSSFIKSGHYLEGMLPAFFLFSSDKFSRSLIKLILQNNYSMFSCIRLHIEFISVNRVRIIVTIDEGYESCPEFFYISKGYWGQLGARIGHKNFNFILDLKGTTGNFEAWWNKESILFKVKRGLHWLFNIGKALQEMTESHEELKHQYEELESSQNILQNQNTLLKTAHEIATSVHQTLDLEETLCAIVNALVKEPGFTFASIRLFSDFHENSTDVSSQAGIKSGISSSIKKEMKIYNAVIEINIQPNSDMDFSDCKDFLEYLTPLINITIHDALVLREVTDYRDNLEQKVAQRTNEIQKARETQNQFFTNISHEFRTPLTLILGPAKYLKSQTNDEQAKEQLDLIYRNAAKLNRLVDELLDIARIESGEMKLKASPVDLVSTVKELAFSFSPLAERKKIAFILNQNNGEIIAYIDNSKFDKILTNVLSNAFKFTPEGGKVEVSINVRAGPVSPSSSHTETPELIRNDKNGFVEISICDTGTGIPQNQVDKIFDRFYQVDSSHTREYGGIGIGLSLTKELIELHKAKIEVDTKEGKGSTFRLIFPLGKDHLKPEEICEEEKQNENAGPDPVSDESAEVAYPHKIDIEFSKKPELPTLLIVEDNPDVRKYIHIILKHQYTIIEAEDGEAGLSKSIECLPDLIISDIMMPKMDGLQMCCKLKTDTRTSHIPVIMLTAKATMQDKLSGLEIGADDYIMKPFEAAELKSRVKNLLEQRKRLHEHFRRYGLTDVDEKNITPVDQKFLQKAIDIISKHISNTSFGVEVLADNLAVSRSLLLKKTEALFGESPSDLIRRIRLNKAAGLIERDYGHISEIAFEVGFSNPSYFAECFRKQFGVAPSQYKKNS